MDKKEKFKKKVFIAVTTFEKKKKNSQLGYEIAPVLPKIGITGSCIITICYIIPRDKIV